MKSMRTDTDGQALTLALRGRGQRVTPQRLVINRALRRLDRHSSAEEVARAIERELPGVSVPTVYSTLELLAELGFARRVTAAPRLVLYDPRVDDHHHLVCRRCGRVDDFDTPLEAADALRSARRHGFQAEHVELVVSGLCESCGAGSDAKAP
jgi:Fe2+ or Zn2+ uptake regulation protein